jgi:hypothetical protein
MIIRLRAPAFVRASSIALAVASTIVTSPGASAQGTIQIQHAGSQPDTYENVVIQVIHDTFNVTSADGKGTLIITRAACSYQGDVSVCLPTAVTLVQPDGTHALDLRSGTLYANTTSSPQKLPFSSTQIPPQGVIMSLQTRKGTFINLTGTIDKVVK